MRTIIVTDNRTTIPHSYDVEYQDKINNKTSARCVANRLDEASAAAKAMQLATGVDSNYIIFAPKRVLDYIPVYLRSNQN